MKLDDEILREIVERKANTRLCCDVCGTRYRFDNMHMCTSCTSVVCYTCVWKEPAKNIRAKCQCGGKFQ